MNAILDILWEFWFQLPCKQKVIGAGVVLLGGLSALIPDQGTNDATVLVMFCIPIGLYLFFSKQVWID